MNRFFIWMGLALALFVARPMMADSTAEPAAATVISLVGQPQVSMDEGKTYQDLHLGDAVSVGAMIHTGEGKVSLLLNDGSTARLAQDTEMTLNEQDPDKASGGTIFAMASGFARFLVNKVKPGNHFEVHTPNAVAAVKGTDFEAGVQGNGQSQVWVFKHDGEGKVELADLKHLLKILVVEEHYASFDGVGFSHGTFIPGSMKDPFKGLDEPKNPVVGGTAPPTKPNVANFVPLDQDAEIQSLTGSLQNSFAQIAATIKTQIHQQQAAIQLGIGQIQLADAVTQRMVTDSSGNQTLVTQSVARPASNTIINTTVNTRTTGPSAGNTTVNETTVFNSALPYDWVSALRAPINPTLYRVAQNYTATDPQSDLFSVQTVYQPPVYQSLETGPLIPGNSYYLQTLSANFIVQGGCQDCGGYTENITLTQNGTGNYNESSTDGDELGLNSVSGSNNGVEFSYFDNNAELQIFTETLQALNDNGSVYNVAGDTEIDVPSAFWATNWPSSQATNGGTNPDVSLPGSVPGLPSAYNVEMVLNSSVFVNSSGIDTVFLPGFFDTYDVSPFQNNNGQDVSEPPPP